MTCCHTNIDKDKIIHNVKNAKRMAQEGVSICKEQASCIISQGEQWARPRAKKAWKKTVKALAPHVSTAANKLAPAMQNAHTKLVEEYIPKIDALAKEEKVMTNKSHKVRNVFLIFTGLVTAVVAGVLVWRRLQPIDDPWAEEYWEDFEDECDDECECPKSENNEEVMASEK